tara:strand:+ start:2235 stop:2996 length:762 start_codon:yes stop_codon:yes gene_type:complete
MKKILLKLLILATFISIGQTTNITSNTTWGSYVNSSGATINIDNGVELTLTGNLMNSGTINLFGCNAKLTIAGALTGSYNFIDINRYCDVCSDINNLSQGYPYSNVYLSANNLSYVDVECQVPLPVELISYTCSKKEIRWSTGAEINSDYFTILYSENGIDFVPIDNINAQGNSFEVVKYSYPITKKGYYKLTQTDYDGTTEEFDIKFCGPDNGEIKLVARYDLLGQAIQDSYRGIVIEVYSDGSTKRIYKNN